MIRLATAAASLLAFLHPTHHANADDLTSVWEVSAKEGGGAKLYLAGSIHLLREEDTPLPAAFGTVYKASDELLLEVSSAEMANAQDESMRRGMYGREGKISDDLSPQAYRQLREFLAGSGLPRNAMDGFRPWMAAMAISLTEMMKIGCRVELGVDGLVESMAVADGKKIGSLETAEFQIGLFSGLDRDQAEAMLTATLGDMAEVAVDFPRMVKAWKEGDTETLDSIMNESLDDQPELRESLLDKRNLAWLDTLERKLAGEKTVMAVVGSGHLVGESGLIALLEERGYRVRQLRRDGKPSAESGRFVEL